MQHNKITHESVVSLIRAATVLQMDASGMHIPDVTNVFGEVNDHKEQVRMAKIMIARIADAYCRD